VVDFEGFINYGNQIVPATGSEAPAVVSVTAAFQSADDTALTGAGSEVDPAALHPSPDGGENAPPQSRFALPGAPGSRLASLPGLASSGFGGGPPAGAEGAGAVTPAEAAAWTSPVVTGDDGKAVVRLTLPLTASQWRFTARGATPETVVGQSTEKVVTREDFFVEVRTPAELQEGDSMPFLVTVHNLTGYEGDATLKLTVEGDQPVRFGARIHRRKKHHHRRRPRCLHRPVHQRGAPET
jgi:hypothetical protein